MAEAADSFWDFSLALYERPGVAAALLGLQDRLGVDVNMVLFCCWAGAESRRLSSDDLAAVEAVAEPWQAEVVRPLRSLRRRLKGGFGVLPAGRVEAFRKRINDLELDGERIAQEAMAAQPRRDRGDRGSAAASVAANLRAYLRLRHAAIGGAERAELTAILRACFPDGDAEEISSAFA
jgi:uncharacterized protein (TIGR02444 family)